MRVVSLCPSLTELVFDLGAGATLVGRTRYCVEPTGRVEAVPPFGGTKNPKVEDILRVRPDLVLMNREENRKEDADALRAGGLHCRVVYPRTVEETAAMVREVGRVLGREKEAEVIARDVEQELEAAWSRAVRAQPHRWAYLIWRKPWMTVSRDTYISQMLALANWKTAGHDPQVRYPEVRVDRKLLTDIDLVLFSSEPFPFKPAHVEEFRRHSGDSTTPCAFIDGEMTSWYGSRAVKGLRYLRELAMGIAEPSSL